MSKDDLIDMQGTVVAVHSGGLYRVQCDAGHEVLHVQRGRREDGGDLRRVMAVVIHDGNSLRHPFNFKSAASPGERFNSLHQICSWEFQRYSCTQNGKGVRNIVFSRNRSLNLP